jgi:murein DD-endopeptidase MepM/ murein hydrolase activator NlpD
VVLSDESLRREGRAGHWLVDAALGAVVALGAITLAHAAKPDKVALVSHTPSSAVTVDIPPDTFAPVTLIAFEDPVPGKGVISPFGLRKLPWEERGRLHAGIDIAADKGAKVVAVADGVVTERGNSATYGRYVELRHAEGLTTLYAHLGGIDIDMAGGVPVRAGETVGRIGSSGVSTGPHLHFEIRDRKRRPLNPALFIGRTFADAEDLPLSKARGVGRRVRVAHVSRIPPSKKAQMQATQERRRNGHAAAEPVPGMDGVQNLGVGEDGRPRAQLIL